MKTFKLKVKYSFTGFVEVKAKNIDEAYIMVEKHCGFTSDRGFHTVLGDDIIPDWEFPVHSERHILTAKGEL